MKVARFRLPLTLFTVTVAVTLAITAPASAAPDPNATGGSGAFEVGAKKQIRGSGDENVRKTNGSPGEWRYVPVCGLGGAETCSAGADCGDGGRLFRVMHTPPGGSERYVSTVCFGDDEAPEVVRPRITNELVLRALRRVPVPAAKLVVQPPGGKTLVNFATIFHTEVEQFTRSVRLLGQRVDLEVTPSSFVWKHGDNTAQTTSTPGVGFAEGRPMSDYITHSYARAHAVKPSVDTTYSARFRVNGGAWRQVIGTVTIDGEPVDLQVVEGRPALVGAH